MCLSWKNVRWTCNSKVFWVDLHSYEGVIWKKWWQYYLWWIIVQFDGFWYKNKHNKRKIVTSSGDKLEVSSYCEHYFLVLICWLLISAYPVFVFVFYVFDRCQEVGSEDRRREKREDKCPFLENSGSEEDILQILQYMATILGKKMK